MLAGVTTSSHFARLVTAHPDDRGNCSLAILPDWSRPVQRLGPRLARVGRASVAPRTTQQAAVLACAERVDAR